MKVKMSSEGKLTIYGENDIERFALMSMCKKEKWKDEITVMGAEPDAAEKS